MKKKKREHRLFSSYLLMSAVGTSVATFLFVLMIAPIQQQIPGEFLPTAQYLAANPGEKPDFLSYRLEGNWLVIEVRGAALWETGDAYLTQVTLSERLNIWINGIEEGNRRYGTADNGLPLFTETRYDAAGNEVGYADDLTVLLDISDMAEGLHIAEVEIETLSGEIYSHQWAFRVGDARTVVYPTLAVIPTELTPTP